MLIQRRRQIIGLCTICLIGILFAGCNTDGQAPKQSPFAYAVPPQTEDGWKTASLDEVGLDRRVVERGVSEIQGGAFGEIHSFLIVRYGKLVFEEYWSGDAYFNTYLFGVRTDFDKDTIHNLASVTKSITSAIFGIAVDRGDIESVDEKVMDYFPEYDGWADEGKSGVTVGHLLTMTSGIAYDEFSYSFNDPRNDTNRLHFSLDPIRFILNKPMFADPGAQFHYNSGSTVLLGEIIRRATGMRMDRFAEEYLFGPLGIKDYKWRMLTPNIVYACGDLKLRPRDIAKIGQLFLQRGNWKGKQLISREWVDKSTAWHGSPPDALSGYGYQWHILKHYDQHLSRELYIYFASGYGGQAIIVTPELDLVVVITAGNYGVQNSSADICPDYVFAAVTESAE